MESAARRCQRLDNRSSPSSSHSQRIGCGDKTRSRSKGIPCDCRSEKPGECRDVRWPGWPFRRDSGCEPRMYHELGLAGCWFTLKRCDRSFTDTVSVAEDTAGACCCFSHSALWSLAVDHPPYRLLLGLLGGSVFFGVSTRLVPSAMPLGSHREFQLLMKKWSCQVARESSLAGPSRGSRPRRIERFMSWRISFNERAQNFSRPCDLTDPRCCGCGRRFSSASAPAIAS